jgi:hypothetical protein
MQLNYYIGTEQRGTQRIDSLMIAMVLYLLFTTTRVYCGRLLRSCCREIRLVAQHSTARDAFSPPVHRTKSQVKRKAVNLKKKKEENGAKSNNYMSPCHLPPAATETRARARGTHRQTHMKIQDVKISNHVCNSFDSEVRIRTARNTMTA